MFSFYCLLLDCFILIFSISYLIEDLSLSKRLEDCNPSSSIKYLEESMNIEEPGSPCLPTRPSTWTYYETSFGKYVTIK